MFKSNTCCICGGKKGRGFNHAKCSKQAQQIERKPSKARKVIRERDIDYLIKTTY